MTTALTSTQSIRRSGDSCAASRRSSGRRDAVVTELWIPNMAPPARPPTGPGRRPPGPTGVGRRGGPRAARPFLAVPGEPDGRAGAEPADGVSL
ncbi:hypothetical protein GCM10029978_114180 [Actinoallomurus acanthiterrae]